MATLSEILVPEIQQGRATRTYQIDEGGGVIRHQQIVTLSDENGLPFGLSNTFKVSVVELPTVTIDQTQLDNLNQEATQQSILTELQAKLNSTDILNVLVDAAQVASLNQETTQQSILTELQNKVNSTDTLEVSIDQLKTNTATHTTVTVTNASTQLISANPLRKKIILHNFGNNNCYISFTAPAQNQKGFILSPGATLFEETWRGDIFGLRAGLTNIQIAVTELT